MNGSIECKECSGSITIPKDVVVGEILTCPDCGTSYEVASDEGKNFVLKTAEDVQEDWGE